MITIQRNQIMIEQYEEVVHVTSKDIRLRMRDTMLLIQGTNLKVLALSQDEILVDGCIEGLLFQHEK